MDQLVGVLPIIRKGHGGDSPLGHKPGFWVCIGAPTRGSLSVFPSHINVSLSSLSLRSIDMSSGEDLKKEVPS